MSLVTKSQMEKFVTSYLQKIQEEIGVFRDRVNYIFPPYMTIPHLIEVTISKTHGVAVLFRRTYSTTTIEIKYIDERIETILPHALEGKEIVFDIKSTGGAIRFINIISIDFYQKYKHIFDSFCRGSSFIRPNMKFPIMLTSGDFRLIDASMGIISNGEELIVRIPYCMLFASNSSEIFTAEFAEQFADNEVDICLKLAYSKFPLIDFEMILKGYEVLLDKTNLKEEVLQEFLKGDPIILDPFNKRIIPKHRLGKDYVTDFIIESPDGLYTLVEIEKASFKLYTQSGPTKELGHAIQQIEDWQRWIQNNISYARNDLPGISSPKGLVIIGRRKTLSKKDLKRLTQLNQKASGRCEVITYDDLLERGRSLIKNLTNKRPHIV